MLRSNRLSLVLLCTPLLLVNPASGEDETVVAPTSAPVASTPTSTDATVSSTPASTQKKIDVKGVSPVKNWISDRVETPVRSCPTDRCRIVKVVRPGNEITVTGYTSDGWAYVSIGEIKGFILKRYLQDVPLIIMGNDSKPSTSSESGGVTQTAKTEMDALLKRTETAEAETGGLRKENYELKQELDYIKGLSNQTLMVNEENRRLKTEVEMLRQRNEILEQEARDGEGRDQRAWVIVGAGIILVGWILGRFARMPRRKGWSQM